jgi:uncharacterized protein (TIGR03435 family)
MLRYVSLLALASIVAGQSVEGPGFEVASLKKLGPDVHDFEEVMGGPGTESPTRATMRWGVETLLREAFNAPSYRFVNLNKLPSGFYEFAAIVPEGATKDEFRTMVRNLLIARFHLRYHRETREIKGYELRVASGGPKLNTAENNPPPPPAGAIIPVAGKDGYLSFPHGVTVPIWGSGARFSVQRVNTTMDEFTRDVLEDWLKAPVVNQTGMTGRYDIVLRWNAANSAPPLETRDSDDLSEPSFIPALRQQLGLILREVKAPGEVIVIDAMDREAAPN